MRTRKKLTLRLSNRDKLIIDGHELPVHTTKGAGRTRLTIPPELHGRVGVKKRKVE